MVSTSSLSQFWAAKDPLAKSAATVKRRECIVEERGSFVLKEKAKKRKVNVEDDGLLCLQR